LSRRTSWQRSCGPSIRNATGSKRSYAWIVKSTALVNHYYFYCVDENFGPFFPYNAKLCLNGHEYARRQLERQQIAYQLWTTASAPGRTHLDPDRDKKVTAIIYEQGDSNPYSDRLAAAISECGPRET
jgi:hypothetical protein